MGNREREKKERDRLYGELVVDFINAKDPDEAFSNLFYGIQKAFNLSSAFSDKMKKRFPPFSAIQEFLPMKNHERNLFEALVEKGRLEEKKEGSKERKSYLPGWEKEVSKQSESFSKDRIEEIREIAEHYRKVAGPLRAFDEYRKQIKIVFESVIKRENIYENQWFLNFFRKSKISAGPHLSISKDGKIFEKSLFYEGWFSGRRFPKAFRQGLAYCLAHFLKSTDNRALIRKCEKCQKFFIASKRDTRIKKCKDCSTMSTKSKEWKMEYMRGYRKKKKIQKEKQGIERKVENYMRNLGITREEALSIIKADSML